MNNTSFAPVPPLLRGCWRREWIRFADGTVDDTSTVIWLQLESKMVDVRVAADLDELASRAGLADCSVADLQRLAQSESSSGYTTCTPIQGDPAARSATAEWHTRGFGVAFQPVSAYPEPGLLEWNADGTVMTERAPSGAYVEEWHRMDGTSEPLVYRVLDPQRQLYVAGSVAVLVRERPVPVPRSARLAELMAETDDPSRLAALVDCEFSVAERGDGVYRITASTLPWKVGGTLSVDL